MAGQVRQPAQKLFSVVTPGKSLFPYLENPTSSVNTYSLNCLITVGCHTKTAILRSAFSKTTFFIAEPACTYTYACYIILYSDSAYEPSPNGGEKQVLSRDCDGCTQLQICSERYRRVCKNEKVYCPDGTAHLVDQN